jgi:predicted XRE-type DNA-binding protein
MAGMSYDKIVAALKAAGKHDAIPVIDSIRVRVKRRPYRMGRHKLTFDDAVNIHKLYHGAEMNTAEIAARIGVNQGRVSMVLNGHQFPEARQHYGD